MNSERWPSMGWITVLTHEVSKSDWKSKICSQGAFSNFQVLTVISFLQMEISPLVTFGNRLSFLGNGAGNMEQLRLSHLSSGSYSLSLPAFPKENIKIAKRQKSNTQVFMGVQVCIYTHVKERDRERIPAPEVWLNPKKVDKGSTVVGRNKRKSYCILELIKVIK